MMKKTKARILIAEKKEKIDVEALTEFLSIVVSDFQYELQVLMSEDKTSRVYELVSHKFDNITNVIIENESISTIIDVGDTKLISEYSSLDDMKDNLYGNALSIGFEIDMTNLHQLIKFRTLMFGDKTYEFDNVNFNAENNSFDFTFSSEDVTPISKEEFPTTRNELLTFIKNNCKTLA